MGSSPEQFLINDSIALYWHRYEAHNFSAVAINSTHVRNPVHHKLLVLVNMDLFAKIRSCVRNGVKCTVCCILPPRVVEWIDLLKRSSNSLLGYFESLVSQKSCHKFATISRSNL